jgi:hypothetical protein
LNQFYDIHPRFCGGMTNVVYNVFAVMLKKPDSIRIVDETGETAGRPVFGASNQLA